jgi:hypothetical protein
MQPDWLQHDSAAACVIAQQFFLPPSAFCLRLYYGKKKNKVAFKTYCLILLYFFEFFKSVIYFV